MIANRPLFYLTLPSIALIMGFLWLRRKKGNQPDNAKKFEKRKSIEINENYIKSNDQKSSEMLDIKSTTKDESIFGKSAPIDIVSNTKNSTTCEITCETTMEAIDDDDEDLESMFSVRLPDSGRRRQTFIFSDQMEQNERLSSSSSSSESPIIIKASNSVTRSPEQQSFLETKYVEEENDFTENHISLLNTIAATPASTITTSTSNVEENIQKKNSSTDSTKREKETGSPPASLCSIQSGDSGKGSSPPNSEATTTSTTYEFLLPTTLVGQLYGRKRLFINQIQSKTGVKILVKSHPLSDRIKICIIMGTMNDINATILLIRNKLPLKRYPNLTLQRVHFVTPQSIVPLMPIQRSCLQLKLVEGINNDVVVSSVISGGHVFLQLPLHPSHPSLRYLQMNLNECYSTTDAPMLPNIVDDAICVGRMANGWCRLQIVNKDLENQTCLVKLIDFGGYTILDFNSLRQIRADFMTIPFQAIECLLSNIAPADSEWSLNTAETLRTLTCGIVLQAQVVGYNSENIPEISLYACIAPNNVVSINKELVARGLAKLTSNDENIC